MLRPPLSTQAFLEGVSRWFAGREGADGNVVCKRHKIEHTGKVVYQAAIDLALRPRVADPAWFDARIRKRVLRTLDMVRSDPHTGASVFFPGSLDHRNAASNLIDSGACCDVLAQVLEEAPALFSDEEREQIAAAVRRVCETYLCRAVLVKEVPAQRLWGATGLARAARALDEPSFADAAREAVARAIAQANADGSIPYMPEPEKHGEHVGLSDVSTYYHSRHVGFILYVYRCLGAEPDAQTDAFVRRALDFLTALYGWDGLKPLANEAKQWYWESEYEVASHAFDVHALVEGASRYRDPRLRALAALSYARLLEHVCPDGGITSHEGTEINFQCRDFWNGHVAWIARVMDDVPAPESAAGSAPASARSAALPPPPVPWGIRVFDDAGLVRVERPGYAALLRGKKKPVNISFGGEIGGGSLVYFGRRDEGFANRLRIPKWSSHAPGNFTVTPTERPSFKQRVVDFYRDNRHDMRFRLYVANIERKAGNTLAAFQYPVRHVVNKLRDEIKGRYTSHFDVAPSVSIDGDRIAFSSMLARRDGVVLKGSSLTRTYVAGPDELSVTDQLTLDLPVRAVLYDIVAGARDLKVTTRVAHRDRDGRMLFAPRTYPATITITYRL